MRRKALLVDDDLLVRSLVAEMMDEIGFEVTLAENAEAALTSIDKTCEYNVLVTDVLMPGMNGWTFSEKVREICPELPVIYVTGFFSDNACPVDRSFVIRKPFHQRELASALGDLLLTTNRER